MPRDLRHVRQAPRGCAAAVVAMLAGCDLDLATYALGRRGAESPAGIARALRRFGLRLGRGHTTGGRLPPRRARGVLVLVQMLGREQHVAALPGDGTVLDPALPGPVRLEAYPAALGRLGLAPLSWLELEGE